MVAGTSIFLQNWKSEPGSRRMYDKIKREAVLILYWEYIYFRSFKKLISHSKFKSYKGAYLNLVNLNFVSCELLNQKYNDHTS